MELVTKRFLLRDFREEDVSAFAAYHADPRSLEFYGAEEAVPGHAQRLLQTFGSWARESPRRNYQLAITQREPPHLLIGCCGLRSAESEDGKAELGIELVPEFWGRYGYAIEVMRALMEFGFRTQKFCEIYGGTVSANARVARLQFAWSSGGDAPHPRLDGCSVLDPNRVASDTRAMGEWSSNNALQPTVPPPAARRLSLGVGRNAKCAMHCNIDRLELI